MPSWQAARSGHSVVGVSPYSTPCGSTLGHFAGDTLADKLVVFGGRVRQFCDNTVGW